MKIMAGPQADPVKVLAACCVHCTRTDHLVAGDGPVVVCRPCVDLLGGAAQDPTSISARLLAHLRRRHREVVALMEANHGAPTWVWIAGWPGVKA